MPTETEGNNIFQESCHIEYENYTESKFESVLDSACKHIKGDCPRVIMDTQPWDCDAVCNEIGNESWKCWKQYFINLNK
jgi:hypothetical protein